MSCSFARPPLSIYSSPLSSLESSHMQKREGARKGSLDEKWSCEREQRKSAHTLRNIYAERPNSIGINEVRKGRSMEKEEGNSGEDTQN